MKTRLDEAIRSLESNPHLGKPLRGELSAKWSLRVGEYRVVYEINESEKNVTLYTVAHRRTVYR